MKPWLNDGDLRLYHGDALEVLRELPSGSVHMCATSPPFYGLRDYGTGSWEGGDEACDHVPDTRQGSDKQDAERRERGERRGYASGSNFANYGAGQTAGDAVYRSECGKCGARRVDRQIGLEETPDEWVARLVAVFREVRRVLRDDGVLFIEIGDSYAANGRYDDKYEAKPDRASGARDTKWALSSDQKHAKSRKGFRSPEIKAKDLLGQPWLLAFALRADGWYLRSEIIWARPNPMPESVTDRPTKAHSTVFLLSKKPRYFYDADAIRTPYKYDGRTVTHVEGGDGSIQHRSGERWPGLDQTGGANARSVWTIPTEPTPFAHFATFPTALVRRMILAGTSERGCCPECGAPWVRETADEHDAEGRTTNGQKPRTSERRGFDVRMVKSTSTLGWSPSCAHDHEPVPCTVLDPFAGSATTMLVARANGRHAIGIELSEEYLQIAHRRLGSNLNLFAPEAT